MLCIIPRYILFCLAVLLSCSLWANAPESASSDQKLTIITSIKPLALITREIAGNNAEIDFLILPSMSPHHFAFKPSDLKKILSADLLIWLGPLEGGAMDKASLHLPANRQLQLLETNHPFQENDHQNADPELDLHPWLTPMQVKALAEKITDKLVEINPVNATRYQQQLHRFSLELLELDKKTALALAPYKKTPFIAMHNAYHRFIQHYQLSLKMLVQENAHQPPGLQHTHQMGIILNKAPGMCLIADPFSPATSMKYLKAHYDIHIEIIDLLGENSDDYQSFERNIRKSFVACLHTSATNQTGKRDKQN